VTDLGSLPGTPDPKEAATFGHGLNNTGQVTGTFTNIRGLYQAFLYNNGQIQNLAQTLPTLRDSDGQGINDAGQIVGSFGVGIHSFLYSSGQVSDLGTLGGSFTFGNSAYAINNAGQVTGYSYTSTIHPHAFLYSNGQIQDLGTLGGNTSYGYGINDNGQVVGAADTTTDLQHAFLYRNRQMTDLGTLSGFTFAKANGINNAGQVVGSAAQPNAANSPPHAFLYTDDRTMDLGTLPGDDSTFGNGINNAGQVVGFPVASMVLPMLFSTAPAK